MNLKGKLSWTSTQHTVSCANKAITIFVSNKNLGSPE